MSRSGEDDRGLDEHHRSVLALPMLQLIRERLHQVFPVGVDGRAYAVAERAARSLYVFLYTFSVDGVTEHRVRPAMVTTMSDGQAGKTSIAERIQWWEGARRPRPPSQATPGRWYAENTREPIRDETFRVWKGCGALLEDPLPTTSALPRYRLARDFADLFNPHLGPDQVPAIIEAWQRRHLTAAALARMALIQQQATASAGSGVRFPDGATRLLAVGPSTPLLKSAVEDFAPRFLRQPVVLAVTESRARLAYEDAAQLRLIKLAPDPRVMPDLLLADVAGPHGQLLLVCLECVATAGQMTSGRVGALAEWLVRQGFTDAKVAFGTVFRDRSDAAFRAAIGELAWGTFAWFTTEPTNLLVLRSDGDLQPAEALDDLARVPTDV